MSNRPIRRREFGPSPDRDIDPSFLPADCGCHVCQGRPKEEADREFAEKALRDGFTIVGTYAPRRPMTLWGYTVGLGRSIGAPELVVTGCDEGDAVWLIRAVHEQLLAGTGCGIGRDVKHQIWCGDHGHDIGLVQVDEELVTDSRLLTVAHDLEPVLGPVLGAVQIVWPDPTGLMPWDPTGEPLDDQPLLDLPLDSTRWALAPLNARW